MNNKLHTFIIRCWASNWWCVTVRGLLLMHLDDDLVASSFLRLLFFFCFNFFISLYRLLIILIYVSFFAVMFSLCGSKVPCWLLNNYPRSLIWYNRELVMKWNVNDISLLSPSREAWKQFSTLLKNSLFFFFSVSFLFIFRVLWIK